MRRGFWRGLFLGAIGGMLAWSWWSNSRRPAPVWTRKGLSQRARSLQKGTGRVVKQSQEMAKRAINRS